MFLFHNFGAMSRKVKIMSIFFATYLGILPLFFYLHALGHEKEFHKEACDKITLLSTENNGEICDLCDTYIKQHVFNESPSFFEGMCEYPEEKVAYFFNAFTIKNRFHRLRAPPSLINKCLAIKLS